MSNKCENCIHYECCCDWVSSKDLKDLSADENCSTYKAKSLFVELPCKVGDKLFQIYTYKMKIHEYTTTEFLFNGNEILIYGEDGYRECAICVDKEIGKTVFLTRELAEGALKNEQEKL